LSSWAFAANQPGAGADEAGCGEGDEVIVRLFEAFAAVEDLLAPGSAYVDPSVT
jgi:hypothetical protein